MLAFFQFAAVGTSNFNSRTTTATSRLSRACMTSGRTDRHSGNTRSSRRMTRRRMFPSGCVSSTTLARPVPHLASAITASLSHSRRTSCAVERASRSTRGSGAAWTRMFCMRAGASGLPCGVRATGAGTFNAGTPGAGTPGAGTFNAGTPAERA